MSPDHYAATLDTFCRRTPYHPFTIVLVNGSRHEVDFPQAIVNNTGLSVFVKPGRIPVIFENDAVAEIIGDLAHMELFERS